MGPNMKVIGIMISKMVMEKKHGQMEHHMKENIKRVRNVEKEYLNGMMEVCMKVSFRIIV